MDFGKLVTAMVTPFDENLHIDWEETGRLIDYLIEEQASDSLVICGTTGESPTLSDEEKLQLFSYAVDRAAGRCKIIAGTGSYDTSHSVHLTNLAQERGVDGVLLVAPYYNRPNQEALYRHFKTIAESTRLPVMLYNIPKRTGVNVEAQTTLRLAELPNVVATKEAHGDLAQITQLTSGAPEGFVVYSGDDDLTLPMLSIGAYGVVSVVSHIKGREIKAMVDAYFDGRVKEAFRLHAELSPMFKGMFICPNPVAVKYALTRLGRKVGSVRLPLIGPSSEESRAIESLLNGIG